jgi:hypothetical protein
MQLCCTVRELDTEWSDFGRPRCRRMSAVGYKRTLWGRASKVRFTPVSRPSREISKPTHDQHWATRADLKEYMSGFRVQMLPTG